ncbi:uncharacterized protein LOC124384862 [Silurus meridionalis]|uniref:uncharacterized protein LOC124384862 n=1 Tax=Silurus meridionalis TaxID=175797 RepID=UPI001EEBE866|nr:uncharacterized protein LOC124384862 [Silurus meridionalis]
MAEQATHKSENVQGTETLSVEEYQKLLRLLKVQLPKGLLTPEVITQSTHPNIIKDAIGLKQYLKNCTLQIAQIPRLACWKIKQALQLKEKDQFQDITKIIFFRNIRDATKETLVKRWENNTQADCGFRIKESYLQTIGQFDQKDTDVSHSRYGNYAENQMNAMDCFEFYLEQKGLTLDDEKYKKNTKLEFEFLSGKVNFLMDIKSTPEDISPTEKVLIKCNSTTHYRAKEICSLPKEGFQAEFNTSHQFYLQAQAFAFILKEKAKLENNPVLVKSVIVLKVKPSNKFYWGEVSDDTEKIKQLNNICKSEALPRFLAVLNLIFEKTN